MTHTDLTSLQARFLRAPVSAPNAWTGPQASPVRMAYRQRLTCWVLRILLGVDGMPAYFEPGTPRMAPLADLLGVPALADLPASASDIRNQLQALVSRLSFVWDTSQPISHLVRVEPCPLLATVDWLADKAGLDAVERDILELVVATRVFRPLRLAMGTWADVGFGDLAQAVAVILNHPFEPVRGAMRLDALLYSSGLMVASTHGEEPMDRKLSVPHALSSKLQANEDDPACIVSSLVAPLQQPGLCLQDFHYLQAHTRLGQAWLAGALAMRKGQVQTQTHSNPHSHLNSHLARGAHLLVHGTPGLGKTEWVRCLLWEFSLATRSSSVELQVLDEDRTALSGEDRLRHLRLAMSLLRNVQDGVIVFDEADDVFAGMGESAQAVGDRSAVSMANHRASLNRLLEDRGIPVIWIMNNTEILDPAVLRRFDAVIAFQGMPRSVRLATLRGRFPETDDPKELVRWAEVASLTPALMDRLAVLSDRAVLAGVPMDASLCRQWLRQRLPGKPTQHLLGRSSATPSWQAELVQASEDLLALAQGIGRCGSARLLLHGAPGTGKTAFAYQLATLLDKPLLERRASDLLSPWVGETEQRIHQAFAAAMEDDAVLFIDEVDSLLASRDHAVRTWEVSQVNELLEQLSDFEGVVVLATNRMDALDAAVLRRMDAKIRFEGLKPDQLRSSFVQLCGQIHVTPTDPQWARAGQLVGLTPGDFACVRRRMAFAPPIGSDPAQVVLEWLQDELRLNTRGVAIGFSMGFPATGVSDIANKPQGEAA